METKDFKQTLVVAYSKLNFEKFCEVIGEPSHYNGEPNHYALEKWNAFQNMCTNMAKLGTFLDKLVEYGLSNQ